MLKYLPILILFAFPAFAVTYQGGKCVEDCPTAEEEEMLLRESLLEDCGIEVPKDVDPLSIIPRGCHTGDDDKDEDEDNR